MRKKKKEYSIGDTVRLTDGSREEILLVKRHIGHRNRPSEYRTDTGRWITQKEISSKN